MAANAVNFCAMEPDDLSAGRRDDPLRTLTRQDLDPFSVEELAARIATLEAEIERSRARMDHARNHRSSADALFRR